MKEAIKCSILILLPVLISGGAGAAISITVTGSWSETIDELDLQAGAGSDLIGTYESASDAVSISISGAVSTWRLDVKKVDTNWHSDLILWVRRTTVGTGGTVSGGTDYLQVSGTDQPFISGSGDVSGIAVQLKLSGMSIQVPQDTYTTTVYYTALDT